MPVKIISRSSVSPLNSGSSSNLVGNVTYWLTTTIRVEAYVGTETSLQNSISINTNNQVTLNSGQYWSNLGVEVGDTLIFNVNTRDASNPVAPDVTTTINTYTVLSLNNNVMTVSGDLTGEGQSVTIPGQSQINIYNWATLVFDKTFTALDFRYNQLINSEVNAPTLNSPFDGSQTAFKGGGVDVTDTVTWVNIGSINPRSGESVYSCEIKGVSKTAGKSTFDIRIVHNIAGYYDDITDILNGTKPSWYLGSEAMADTFQAKFYKTLNDENVTVISSLTDNIVQKVGSTGWFNENRNGGTNNYAISNVRYEDPSGDTVSGLRSTGITVLFFNIDGSGFTNTSKFNFGIGFCPLDRTTLNNTSTTILGGMCANTLGVAQSYSHTASKVVSTIQGFANPSGARIDVLEYWFNRVSATLVEVEIRLQVNSAFTTYVNNLSSVDNNFIFWASVGDENPILTTDRVNLYEVGQLAIESVPVDPYPNIDKVTPFKYDEDFYDDEVYSSTNPTSLVTEDDFHVNFKLNTSYFEVIKNVNFGIELYETTSGDNVAIATLDSFGYNLQGSPISSLGIQEINLNTNRQFQYVSNFKENKVSLVRNPAADGGGTGHYNFTIPFRMRWEWWLQNNIIPTSFYDSSQPNNNLNNEWFTKLSGDVGIRYFIELDIEDANGVETSYKNTYDFDLLNYDNDVRFTKRVELFSDVLHTDSLLINASVTDGYTAAEYGIIENATTYIKAEIEKPSGNFGTFKYGEITIEVRNGGGWLSMWKIRTDQTPTANNPLQNLVSSSATSKRILTCTLDSTLLPSNLEYKITAEWVGAYTGDVVDYQDRALVWGRVVRLPEPDPSESRNFEECCYELPVLASTTDDSLYKNDIKGLLYKRATDTGNIELYLIDEQTGTEYALNNNDYGVYLPFGSFTYEPNVIAYQIRWRQVLATLGEGCYSFKRIVTEFGNETTFYSCKYHLQEYSIDAADKTVRIESIQNGWMEETDINYKGFNWGSHLRFAGKFGYEEPNYDSTFLIDTNNNKQLNRQDLTSEFILNSKLIPHKCLAKPLYDYYLRGTDLFISDYNKDNHSYDYISKPVILVSVESTKYFERNRNAKISIRFAERVIARRTSTCVGDRPLPYLAPTYVFSDYCSGGVGGDVDIEVNGNFLTSVTAPATYDVEVINNSINPVGTIFGGQVVIDDSDITVNSIAFTTVNAEGTANIVVKDTLGATVGSKIGSEWIVPSGDPKNLVIRFQFPINQNTATIVVDSDLAGTISGSTNDGSSGSITITVNAVAISYPQVLTVGQTIVVTRTVVSAAGWVKLNGSYV